MASFRRVSFRREEVQVRASMLASKRRRPVSGLVWSDPLRGAGAEAFADAGAGLSGVVAGFLSADRTPRPGRSPWCADHPSA